MRAFIAIEISDEIREALAKAEEHLKYSGADVKWVAPENIHLTLKFLGEVDEARIEKVKATLDEIGKATKPFEMTIKGLGVFPKIDFPRVIWAGLDKGAAESAELAKSIDDELSKLGFERESRPFAAHLTIGRVRSPKNKSALAEKLSNLQLTSAERSGASPKGTYNLQLIQSITLYKSTLTPRGSIYTKLHEAKLCIPSTDMTHDDA